MSRDDQLEAIAEIGRQTRRPTPRWLWIAAAIAGAIGLAGFAVIMLSGDEPAHHRIAQYRAAPSGFAIGLAIGAAIGLVIGIAIGRQRRSHSSRSRP